MFCESRSMDVNQDNTVDTKPQNLGLHPQSTLHSVSHARKHLPLALPKKSEMHPGVQVLLHPTRHR